MVSSTPPPGDPAVETAADPYQAAQELVGRAAQVARALTHQLAALPELQEAVRGRSDELADLAHSLGQLHIPPPPSRRELLTAPDDDLTEAQRRAEERAAESLTNTEEQVATLAAQGLTNAEIGDRLHMSANTVKTHLVRVYAKLGLSSRRELTRRITRHQP